MSIIRKSAWSTMPAILVALTIGTQAMAFNFKGFNKQNASQQTTQTGGTGTNAPHDKWAVLIGVSNFKDTSIPAIKYGAESAGKLGRVFQDPYAGNFKNDHLVVLQQDDATRETIEDVLTNGITSKALPNDLIIVYISTRWLPNKSGKEMIFAAVDTQSAKPDETGLDLSTILSTIRRRTQSHNILCLLDLSPIKEFSSTDGLFLNIPKSKTPSTSAIGRLSSISDVNIVSATNLSNSSAQTPFTETSYFARFLIEDIKGSAGAASIATIEKMLIDQVHNTVRAEQKMEQAPDISNASDSLPNLTIGAAFNRPKNVAVVAGFPSNLKGIKFGIDAGRMPIDHPELLPGAGIGMPVAPPSPAAVSRHVIPNANANAGANPAVNIIAAAPPQLPYQVSSQQSPTHIASQLSEPGAKQIDRSMVKPVALDKLPGSGPPSDKDDDDDDQPSKDVDMSSYIAEVKKAIQAKWQPPKGLEQHKAVAVFTIMRDGTIQNAELVEPSGNSTVDKAALDALKAASPLPSLPAGAPKSVQLKYKFEWKVTKNHPN